MLQITVEYNVVSFFLGVTKYVIYSRSQDTSKYSDFKGDDDEQSSTPPVFQNNSSKLFRGCFLTVHMMIFQETLLKKALGKTLYSSCKFF